MMEWQMDGHWEDYYLILGVESDATPEEIREAHKYKRQIFHPDHHAKSLQVKAEDDFKKVDLAYQVLINPDKRREYDQEWLKRLKEKIGTTAPPPKPVLDPSYIFCNNAEPGKIIRRSFIIRNAGGPYTRVRWSNPKNWVTVMNYFGSGPDGEDLPVTVEIDIKVDDWDKRYRQNIRAFLDEEEIQLTVELQSKPRPIDQESMSGCAGAQSSSSYSPPGPFQTTVPIPPKKGRASLFLKMGALLFLMALILTVLSPPHHKHSQAPQQVPTSFKHIPTQPKPVAPPPSKYVPAKPKPVEKWLYTNPESNRARQIMAKNFLGIDETSQHFKVEMTQESIENLKEIPFSEDVLISCKDTHILVADLGLSLLDIKDRTEKLFSFPWYKSENFAKVTDQPQWRLLRKNATPNSYNSFNEGWDRQQSTLAQDEKIPTIRQMAYAVILNYLVNRERLLQDAYLKCSDVDSLGYRLSLGNFTEDGLGIFSGWYIFDINKGFGLASARKPQK